MELWTGYTSSSRSQWWVLNFEICIFANFEKHWISKFRHYRFPQRLRLCRPRIRLEQFLVFMEHVSVFIFGGSFSDIFVHNPFPIFFPRNKICGWYKILPIQRPQLVCYCFWGKSFHAGYPTTIFFFLKKMFILFIRYNWSVNAKSLTYPRYLLPPTFREISKQFFLFFSIPTGKKSWKIHVKSFSLLEFVGRTFRRFFNDLVS